MGQGTTNRIQLHLSTALALMIAAGVLIWANTCKYASGLGTLQGFPLPYLSRGDIQPALLIFDIAISAGLLLQLAWVFESIIAKEHWFSIVNGIFVGFTLLFFSSLFLIAILQVFFSTHSIRY